MKIFTSTLYCILLYMVLPTAAGQNLASDSGLRLCISHLTSLEEYRDLTLLPGQLMTKTAQTRTYYINATLTVSQSPEVLGFVCTTTSTGEAITELREFERSQRAMPNLEHEK